MAAWYQFKKRNPRRGRLGMFIFWTFIPIITK